VNRLTQSTRLHARPEPEPPPLMRRTTLWRIAAHVSTVGLFLLALVICLELARPILLPIVSAVVIGTMLGPLSRRAVGHKMPPWLYATIVVVLIIVLFQALMIVVSRPLAEGIDKAPEYVTLFTQKFEALQRDVPALHRLRDWIAAGTSMQFDPAYLQPVVAFVTPALGQLVVFFATLFFFLLERTEIRRELVLVFREQEDRLRALRIMNDVEADLTRYIAIVSVINFALGLITGVGAYVLGLPNPVLIGTLTFVGNYLPYLGPAFIAATLFVTGLIAFPTLGDALLPPVLFVALATAEGHFITPNIVGSRLTLNPLAVVLCLSFWTWLWGPVGAFLSVPFLIVGLVVFTHLTDKQEGELPD
jgi:predicted PurR-regulated permease PerM